MQQMPQQFQPRQQRNKGIECYIPAPVQPQPEANNRVRRKQKLSVIDLTLLYNIAEDLLSQHANVTYAQLLQIPKQRQNLAQALQCPIVTTIEATNFAEAVLDSENAVSILSRKLVKKLGLTITEPSNAVVITANKALIENLVEIMLLGIDWFQKVHAHLHFDKKKLILQYLGKSIENVDNSAIYLTNNEEILIQYNHLHSESILKNKIEQLIQIGTLNQEQEKEAIITLKKHSRLFTTRLDQLGYAAVIQHKIDIGKAKLIKYQPDIENTIKEYPDQLSHKCSKVPMVRSAEGIEIFRAIIQEYFFEESGKEMEIITERNNEKREDNNITNEGLTNTEVEYEKHLRDFFIKLAMGARIKITWSTVNGYQNVLIINDSFGNRPQLMDLDETYLINIPQWEEPAERLEFEENNYNEYQNTKYGYYQSDIEYNSHYWNAIWMKIYSLLLLTWKTQNGPKSPTAL
ncbi:9257_t:CDS:2 [Cetraspora pellucida]|uniref:9257_t:CDS:1 n=1 Tax=Cetraspora pellucida TaxID=1433469 RepID=A0ACA9JWX0_9GLOM|nr:9257_t:CDS:2 [Cetraspora pellucida]